MDEDLGYRCWRLAVSEREKGAWQKQFDNRLDAYRPHVVLGYPSPACPLLSRAAQKGYPVFYVAHNLAAVDHGIMIPDEISVIANSPYTAAKLSEITKKVVGIVLEMVEGEAYRVAIRDPRYITFVNPVCEKGVDVAIDIARALPNESFLFVKGGWLQTTTNDSDALLSLPMKPNNVDVWEYQADMRSVYKETDILLVPSQFNETFGRVIVEAHMNSIPVIAANVGGIRYTLGTGGILVEPKDQPRVYVDALTRLRADETFYRRLSMAAFENSQRPEFDPELQVDNFIRLVESHF
jgi:glycosyltransferase involved in cell wall biosynthesis